MLRLVVTILATIVIVAFAMANTHRVELSFVIGAPVEVRLVFLLATSFVVGLATAMFVQLVGSVRARARARRENKEAQ